MLLIRTDETGVPIWERQFGTPDWDLCNTMEVLADGFVLGGISYGAGTPIGAAYVVRTDLNGDTIWTTTTGGAFRTECSGIAATSDMGLIIAGVMGTISGFDDGFLTKLDEAGNEEWTTPLGGDSADYLVSVLVTPGGDLVASGGTHSLNPYMQIYVVSLNAGGGVNWERDLGSVADAAATEIRMDHAGGFVFTGYNTLNAGNRDMILTVTDANGWFQFGYNFGDGEPADGYSIDPTDDGGYVVAGWAENYGPGVRSMYVVKTDSIGHTASLSVDAFLDPLDVNDIPPQWYALNLFPNPATGHALITLTGLEPSASFDLEILDATGRIMLSTDLPAGERTIALKGLSPGMYLVELRSRGVRVASVRLCIE